MVDRAASLALDALASQEYRAMIDGARERLGERPTTDKKWREAQESFNNLTNDEIIGSLLREIDGMEIDSFGYTRGTAMWWFYGTKAMDGGSSGPILLNRAALHKASAESLANTIVHEAAHRIGLSHPNTGECEAPYLIGDLVQASLSSSYVLPCKA